MINQIYVREITIPAKLPKVLNQMHDLFGVTDPQKSIRCGTQVDLLALEHPMVMGWLRGVARGELIGAWSNRVANGGGHVRHKHPRGGRSNVVYVTTPEAGSGHLVFYDAAHRPVRRVVPRAGMVVRFPCSLEHATTRYKGDTPRLAVAFDTR